MANGPEFPNLETESSSGEQTQPNTLDLGLEKLGVLLSTDEGREEFRKELKKE